MEKEGPQECILVVDDNPVNIDVLLGTLIPTYAVKVALNSETALSLCSGDNLPDLILLDIMMPGTDGYEVCRRLKAGERTSGIPIIFISAMNADEDESKGLELGAVDYITKPIRPSILKVRIKTQLTLLKQRKRLEANYARLQKLEALRDNLVHMLVHDMRTPLAGINAYQQLCQDIVPEDQIELQRFLRGADEATQKLIGMVNELLNVSRLEHCEMPFEKTSCSADNLCGEALQMIGSNAERVDMDIADDLPGIYCDQTVMVRILTNLLANAIKFSPASARVRVLVELKGERIRFEVQDYGPGIADEDRDRIFEKFGQIEMRHKNRMYSSGLGLTFCKLAVDSHGGAIGVDSEQGKGSIFWIEIPYEGSEAQKKLSADAGESNPRRANYEPISRL